MVEAYCLPELREIRALASKVDGEILPAIDRAGKQFQAASSALAALVSAAEHRQKESA